MLLIISEHEHLDYESFVENEWFNDFFFDNIYSQSIYDNDMSITYRNQYLEIL